MHLLPVLLVAASVVSAIPSRSRHHRIKRQASVPSGSPTTTVIPTSTPLISDTAPTATYFPTVHWDTNTTGHQSLAPQDYHKFYYAQDGVNDPTQNAGMAFAGMNFTLPSVALEHSDAIENVQCPSINTMIITFGSGDALRYALQTWPQNGTDFILVSYFEGCGSHALGERSYFAVGNFTSSNTTTSVTANGYDLDLVDAAEYLSVEFGVYIPPNEMPSNITNSYGFTQAPLGDDFDELLDDLIGFENINSTSSVAYAASMVSSDLDDEDETEDETADELANDDFTIPVLNTTSTGNYTSPSNTTSKRALRTSYRSKALQKRLGGPFKVFDASIEVPKDPKLEDSPFGQAIKIGEFSEDGSPGGGVTGSGKMTVFCVDCGVKGHLLVQGRVEISIIPAKITKAEVNVEGSLSAGLSLGFDAQVLFTKEIKQSIVSFPITPFTFLGFSVGPVIKVDTRATLQLNATGQLLIGATLNMPNPTATLDMLDGKNSKSDGWKPETKPVFKASGQISASAELGFPIDFAIGIQFPFGIKGIDAALVDEPSLKATITIAGSVALSPQDTTPVSFASAEATVEASGGRKRYAASIGERVPSPTADTKDLALLDLTPRDDDACNNGVELALDFINRIYFEFLGNQVGNDLAKNVVNIAKKCFPIGSVKNSRSIDNSTLSQANTTSAGSEFDYQLPSVLEESYTDDEGNTWGALLETTSSDLIVACDDGNLFLHSAAAPDSEIPGCVTSWVSRNTTTVADAAGRIMHYYSDTMAKAGVSRLRMSDQDDVPATSTFVTIQPSTDDTSIDPGTPNQLVAVDDRNNIYFLILCDIVQQASKVFLANDPVKGAQTLMDPELMYSITGGVVESCAALTVTSNSGN